MNYLKVQRKTNCRKQIQNKLNSVRQKVRELNLPDLVPIEA